MTTQQIEAFHKVVCNAFAHLTDAEVAQLVMEPYAELKQHALAHAA